MKFQSAIFAPLAAIRAHIAPRLAIARTVAGNQVGSINIGAIVSWLVLAIVGAYILIEIVPELETAIAAATFASTITSTLLTIFSWAGPTLIIAGMIVGAVRFVRTGRRG